MGHDGEIVIVRPGEDLRQPLGPFHVLDLGDDSDLGELRGEDLSALPCVARRRQLQGHFERRRDPRLSQQLLGLLRDRTG